MPTSSNTSSARILEISNHLQYFQVCNHLNQEPISEASFDPSLQTEDHAIDQDANGIDSILTGSDFQSPAVVVVNQYKFLSKAQIKEVQLAEDIYTLLEVKSDFFLSEMLLEPVSAPDIVVQDPVKLPVGMEAHLNSKTYSDRSTDKLVIFGFLPDSKVPSRCRAIINTILGNDFFVVPLQEVRFSSNPKNCQQYCADNLQQFSEWLSRVQKEGFCKFNLKPVVHAIDRSEVRRSASAKARKIIFEGSPSSKVPRRASKHIVSKVKCCDAETKLVNAEKQIAVLEKEISAIQKTLNVAVKRIQKLESNTVSPKVSKTPLKQSSETNPQDKVSPINIEQLHSLLLEVRARGN